MSLDVFWVGRAKVGLIVVFAGALGLVWWYLSILLLGNRGLAAFMPGTALSVALLMLTSYHPVTISIPMGLAPLVAAAWTAPTGDGDGLWVAILPLLLGWTVALLGVGYACQPWQRRRLEGKRVAGRAAVSRSTRGLIAEALVVALAVVGAVWLQLAVVAGPWADLESQLSTYPVPDGFVTVGVQREGSQRCSTPECRPRLSLKMHSALNTADSCQAFKKSLQRWPESTAVSETEPIADGDAGYWEKCAYVTSNRLAGMTREVQAAVSTPPASPVEVTVTVLDHCALTC